MIGRQFLQAQAKVAIGVRWKGTTRFPRKGFANNKPPVTAVKPKPAHTIVSRPLKEHEGHKRWFYKPMSRRPCVAEQRARNTALDEAAKSADLPWRTVGATILHRYPCITKEAEQWEIDLENVQSRILDAKTSWAMEQIKDTPAQIIADPNISYDEIIEQLPFKPAPRISEADIANDRRSLERKYDSSLFLVVKRNREDKAWQFPQGKWLEGETLRGTAERVLERAVGRTKAWWPSNAPIGHYTYAYPQDMQQSRKAFGAKVFFYRTQFIAGQMKFETRLYTDYAWISRDEVSEYFDEDTAKYLKALLPD